MIEIKKNTDYFNSCLSCGKIGGLRDIIVRRRVDSNAIIYSFCKKCRKELANKLTREG